MKNNQIMKNCAYCKKEFLARNWKNRPGKFCNAICRSKGRNHETKMVYSKCQLCNKEFSQPLWWKSPAKFCSIKCMSKVRGQNMQGIKHPNWKGGFSRPHKERKAVKLAKEKRKKCELCGSVKDLHGHHKVKFSERRDLCDVLENIQVLCSQCHAKEHPEINCISRPILRKGVYLNCEICDKEYYVPKYREKTSTCCSQKCSLKKATKIRYKKG